MAWNHSLLHGVGVVGVDGTVLSALLLMSVASLSGEEAGKLGRPTFVSIGDSAHVAFKCEPIKTSRKYLIETMVGGVAMLDYDGDGLLDLFFVNGAALQDPMPRGRVRTSPIRATGTVCITIMATVPLPI